MSVCHLQALVSDLLSHVPTQFGLVGARTRSKAFAPAPPPPKLKYDPNTHLIFTY
jgi:hypothetical protein